MGSSKSNIKSLWLDTDAFDAVDKTWLQTELHQGVIIAVLSRKAPDVVPWLLPGYDVTEFESSEWTPTSFPVSYAWEWRAPGRRKQGVDGDHVFQRYHTDSGLSTKDPVQVACMTSQPADHCDWPH